MKVELVVKGLLINQSNGKILLLKRSDTDHIDPNQWETVGGKVEEGETLEKALKREIEEESRLEVNVGKLAYVTKIDKNEPILIIAYFCSLTTMNIKLSVEHSDYKWVNKKECKEIIENGIHMDFIKEGIYDLDWFDLD